jgi:hypothetical protein
VRDCTQNVILRRKKKTGYVFLAGVWKLGEIRKNTLGKEDAKYRELPRRKT